MILSFMDDKLTKAYIVQKRTSPFAKTMQIFRSYISGYDSANHFLFVPEMMVIGGITVKDGKCTVQSNYVSYHTDATTLAHFGLRLGLDALDVLKETELDTKTIQVLRQAADAKRIQGEISNVIQSV